MEEVKLIKCVAVGDGFVGKTRLLMSLSCQEYKEDYMPTIFDNTSVKVEHGGKNYELVLIDTAGQEDYSLLRQQAYDNVNVFLICFSVSNIDSFLNVKEHWLPEISKYSENSAKILIGTKCDLRTDLETIDRLNANGKIFVGKEMAVNLANSQKMNYIECSGKINFNIPEINNLIIEHGLSSLKKRHSIHIAMAAKGLSSCYCINPVMRLIQRVLCCRPS